MIALEGVHARGRASLRGAPAAALANVTLTWERGVLAVLGSPADGTRTLLEILTGAVRVRAGRVTVEGRDPSEARASVAHVPLDAVLPDALRVEEVCDLASELRGEPRLPVASRLATLGLEALARRRVPSLTPGEVRGVALALALSSSARVLLIEEPLAGLDGPAPAHIAQALRARGGAGAAVIVTTASVREATRFADQLGVLTRGVFTHLHPALPHVGPGGAKLRVVLAASSTAEIAPFVAALSHEPAVTSIETAAFAATRVLHAAVATVVSGPDLLALARAVQTAAASTRVQVEAIESAVMPLDAIRAALAAPRLGPQPSRPPGPVPGQGAAPPVSSSAAPPAPGGSS